MLVNEIVNSENTQGFSEFMQHFDDLEYQKSFATNTTIKHPRRKNGLISTYDLLNELEKYSDETVYNVKEFIQKYGNMEVLEDKYDNTCNYGDYLDNYLDFGVFELETGQVLATVSVCPGLDPRGAYTKQVAFVYYCEFDFLETLATNYEFMQIEFTVNSKKYRAMFDGNALNVFCDLNITDLSNHEIIYNDQNILDTTDTEAILDTLTEILETEKISIDKIDYFCYACQLRKIIKPP